LIPRAIFNVEIIFTALQFFILQSL